MVMCVIIGCSKRTGRDKDVKFYRIPTVRTSRPDPREVELSTKRRQGYLAAISRPELTTTELEESRICSRHFVFGKPASLFDECHPDWLPTLNLGHSTLDASTVLSITARYERRKARGVAVQNEAGPMDTNTPDTNTPDTMIIPDASAPDTMIIPDADTPDTNNDNDLDPTVMDGIKTMCDAEVQTDDCEDVSLLRSSLNDAYLEIHQLKEKVTHLTPFTEASMKDKPDEFIQHYTGLPNFAVLKTIYDFIAPSQHRGKLAPFQEYLVTLIKLRLNSSIQDISYRFDVSTSTISRILLKWLTIMDVHLSRLILWPERQDLRKTMPECFRNAFGDKVAVIIDCFEVFIDRPSNLLARSCTWSSYKHHNTIKLLIGKKNNANDTTGLDMSRCHSQSCHLNRLLAFDSNSTV